MDTSHLHALKDDDHWRKFSMNGLEAYDLHVKDVRLLVHRNAKVSGQWCWEVTQAQPSIIVPDSHRRSGRATSALKAAKAARKAFWTIICSNERAARTKA
ncbi:MAG: hypothetical protein AAGF55_01020 [Pseudomonadota bacterium]